MITTLYLCLSVDGFIATSNRIANEESEWSDSAWAGWCGYCTNANNLIVGRKTYDELTAIDVSGILYPKHKIVISSQDLSLHDGWTHFSTPNQAIEFLRTQDIERAIVGGGRQIGLAFLQEDLIDEVILDIQPILFGFGTPLLGELKNSIQLEFLNTSEIDNGAYRVHYKVRKRQI